MHRHVTMFAFIMSWSVVNECVHCVCGSGRYTVNVVMDSGLRLQVGELGFCVCVCACIHILTRGVFHNNKKMRKNPPNWWQFAAPGVFKVTILHVSVLVDLATPLVVTASVVYYYISQNSGGSKPSLNSYFVRNTTGVPRTYLFTEQPNKHMWV